MFVKTCDLLNTLSSKSSTSCLRAYFECIHLLSTLGLSVFRSDSGKHLVYPLLACKDSFVFEDEKYSYISDYFL